MSKLPAQAHSTAVAQVSASEDYQIDSSMVKLPSLYLAQFSSKAFKARTVDFGDIYVALGAEDPEPVVVGKASEPLSEPTRFYVHRVAPGYQVKDESAPYGKRSLRPGTPYGEALMEGGADPRNVFLQTHYSLTIPAYPLMPVRFIMGSRWGGSAARWINSQIAIARQKGEAPLNLAFQIQTHPTHNESGDFVDAVVGFAKVSAKDAGADHELILAHQDLLSTANIQPDYVDESVDVSEAPSLA